MNEQFISSEIAEKLKKLNFNEPCLGWYEYDEDGEFLVLLSGVRGNKKYRHINGYFGVLQHDLTKNKTLAPLYQQAQKWLREVHNIHIQIIFLPLNNRYVFEIYKYGEYNIESVLEYSTYELALEQGILEALKLIK